MELLTNTITPWQPLATLATLLLLYLIITALLARFRLGLRNIPGPFLASISSIPRIYTTYTGHSMHHHITLHRKYGPLVRIGPNHVSFSDPSLIPIVYGVNSDFRKSNFYTMSDVKTPTGWIPSIFSVRDDGLHRVFKRKVAGAYAMSALRELEPMNDECSAIFMQKMGEKAGEVVDLGVSVHWYAWDTISSITFSNRLGFMEQERDINNIIAAIDGRLKYNSIIGQVPQLHNYLFGNPVVAYLASYVPSLAMLNSAKYIVSFTQDQITGYQENSTLSTSSDPASKDMLTRFLRTPISPSELLTHTTGNIFAGSDTTAASLRSIFYHLLRNPSTYRTLQTEIDTAHASGKLSDPITFAESQTLPYLQAVIKEAMRMHPAVGMLLERIVPESSPTTTHPLLATLPPGTILGINPWVAARDPQIYLSPETFWPERWLSSSEEHLKVMERNFLAFGAGSRTCLGKNVSLLEMGKLVPLVLRRFELELVEPEKEWEMRDYWFVQQTGLKVRMKERGQGVGTGG